MKRSDGSSTTCQNSRKYRLLNLGVEEIKSAIMSVRFLKFRSKSSTFNGVNQGKKIRVKRDE